MSLGLLCRINGVWVALNGLSAILMPDMWFSMAGLDASNAALKEEVKFPIHSRYNANLLKGVVSRKKQLLPYIASMLKNLGIKG